MNDLAFLKDIESQVAGKTFFMMVGNRDQGSFYFFNTGLPDAPKLEQDWFALNYFESVSDVTLVSVTIM
jgi:hypothetical protein